MPTTLEIVVKAYSDVSEKLGSDVGVNVDSETMLAKDLQECS